MEQRIRFPKTKKLLKEKGIEEDSKELEICPKWLRESYLSEISHCEHTNCKRKNLQIHRLKRGWEGGLYNPDNVKIACSYHHPLYHRNEFSRCQAK